VNKKDIQRLFSEIKAERARSATKNATLFSPPKKKGCRTCGKVNWKPNKE
jgi:hypothetical protein